MFRLDRLERFALTKMWALLPDDCEAWLFGSRTDMQARGGDIDVMVQTNLTAAQHLQLSQRLTLEFQRHCEEKIDIVVYPKTNFTPEQTAFLNTIHRVPLCPIVHAPLLDHVALLCADLRTPMNFMRDWGFAFQPQEEFEGEGTRECYIGETLRPARILLLQAIKDGPYQRTLHKRGPGLHHIGVLVFRSTNF